MVQKRGWTAVLIGRMISGVRSLILISAGVAIMPFLPFISASAIGTFPWTSMLTSAGYWLGVTHCLMEGWIEPLRNGVLDVALSISLSHPDL